MRQANEVHCELRKQAQIVCAVFNLQPVARQKLFKRMFIVARSYVMFRPGEVMDGSYSEQFQKSRESDSGIRHGDDGSSVRGKYSCYLAYRRVVIFKMLENLT